MALILTSASPAEVEDRAGIEMTLLGTFPVGIETHIYVGVLGTNQDPPAYPGIPGQGYTFYPTRADRLKIYLPRLTLGVQIVTALSLDGNDTLTNAFTVRPRQFRTSVFSLKSILPSRWKLGPRNLEIEP
jgi:hypothetical protein